MAKVFLYRGSLAKPGKPQKTKPEAFNPERLAEMQAIFPGLRSGGMTDSSMKDVGSYLKGSELHWYDYSIPLPSARIDPLYREVARQLGGQITLGGGSDLIETALLGTGKIASLGEINRILDKKFQPSNAIDMLFQRKLVSSPAWGGRPELKEVPIGINGESGNDLMDYVENAKNGNYLIKGNPTINVPFKHSGILVIPANGEARLYFRTVRDLENYSKKILTLPDEEKYPADWHVSGDGKLWVSHSLYYSLMVYVRAKKQGWQYSAKSKEILLRWVEHIKATSPEEATVIDTRMKEYAKEQGVTAQEVESVLTEYGLK